MYLQNVVEIKKEARGVVLSITVKSTYTSRGRLAYNVTLPPYENSDEPGREQKEKLDSTVFLVIKTKRTKLDILLIKGML